MRHHRPRRSDRPGLRGSRSRSRRGERCLPGPLRRVARAALVLVLLLVFPFEAVRAFGSKEVVGTLNGEPVRLEEVDAALEGSIRALWREMEEIVRASAHGICAERAIDRLAGKARLDPDGWRAERWVEARPGPEEIGAHVEEHPEVFAGIDVDPDLVGHRLRVTRYRDEIARRVDAELAGHWRLHLDAVSDEPDSEPLLPPVVADCFDRPITRSEVEAFASFPLYRRRAEIVQSTCRQFEIDHSNPLLLSRMARSQGISVAELMKRNEGSFEPLSETAIEEEARRQYGDGSPISLLKARIGLEAKRRLPGRIAFLEGLRENTTGVCRLSMPAPPVVRVREEEGQGRIVIGPEDGLPVYYFGHLRCRHCRRGIEILEKLKARYGERVRIEFRHHFPDTWLLPFEDALDATCQADPRHFFRFARTRVSKDPGSQISLDKNDGKLEECRKDPRTAVRVLNDTQEALRLGFRDAVPSWVIGERPRRGFQGEALLIETIEKQLRRSSTQTGG